MKELEDHTYEFMSFNRLVEKETPSSNDFECFERRIISDINSYTGYKASDSFYNYEDVTIVTKNYFSDTTKIKELKHILFALSILDRKNLEHVFKETNNLFEKYKTYKKLKLLFGQEMINNQKNVLITKRKKYSKEYLRPIYIITGESIYKCRYTKNSYERFDILNVKNMKTSVLKKQTIIENFRVATKEEIGTLENINIGTMSDLYGK